MSKLGSLGDKLGKAIGSQMVDPPRQPKEPKPPPNPKRELLPGMYVRVLIEQGIDSDAIAVPQQAVQRNGGGSSEVFVVKDDNRVAIQPVRTGSAQGGQWFIT